MPWTGILFTVGALAITAIPPFNGFASKKLIMTAVAPWPAARGVLWFSGVVTFAAYLRLSLIFFGPAKESPRHVSIAVPGMSVTSLVVLALLCAGMGLFPGFWSAFFISAAMPSGASAVTPVPAVYSLCGIAETALVIFSGVVLYIMSIARPGRFVATGLRLLRIGLNGILCAMLAGFIALAVVLGN
jgi:formate hydrogenlyase subunit 3/multisubunit Na+/H+ antiporter MnhD subunit